MLFASTYVKSRERSGSQRETGGRTLVAGAGRGRHGEFVFRGDRASVLHDGAPGTEWRRRARCPSRALGTAGWRVLCDVYFTKEKNGKICFSIMGVI